MSQQRTLLWVPTVGAGIRGPMDSPAAGDEIELVVGEDACVLHLHGDDVHVVHGAGTHRLWVTRDDEALVCLRPGPMPVIELEIGRSLPFSDPVLGPQPILLEGAAALNLDRPVAFYHAFLRSALDLPETELLGILSALLRTTITRCLIESYDTCDEIERDLGRLSAWIQRHAEPGFASVGIGVEELELTRMETPSTGGSEPVPLSQLTRLASTATRR